MHCACACWRTSREQPRTSSGRPFLQNFALRDYHAHNQNWAAVQDAQGILHFGNKNVVLEYDGVSWRKVSLSQTTYVRGLAIEPSTGRMFAGAVGRARLFRERRQRRAAIRLAARQGARGRARFPRYPPRLCHTRRHPLRRRAAGDALARRRLPGLETAEPLTPAKPSRRRPALRATSRSRLAAAGRRRVHAAHRTIRFSGARRSRC